MIKLTLLLLSATLFSACTVVEPAVTTTPTTTEVTRETQTSLYPHTGASQTTTTTIAR